MDPDENDTRLNEESVEEANRFLEGEQFVPSPTPAAFRDWLAVSKTGQVFIYHTGFLAVDRGTIVDYGVGDVEFVPTENVDDIGRIALAAFEADRVHLFQRKIHDHVYQYIALKRRNAGRKW